MTARVDLPRLHIVTDDALLTGDDFISVAGPVLQEGGGRVALHLRGPSAPGRRVWEVANALSAIAADTGSLLVINDRIDVALGVDSEAVQLGERSLDIGIVRQIVNRPLLIGKSIHSATDASRAKKDGADYLLAGTLYRSASHPGRAPAGLGWLPDVTALGLPIIGIGGIDREKVSEAMGAGLWGVAVVSAVWRSADPSRSTRELLEAIEKQ